MTIEKQNPTGGGANGAGTNDADSIAISVQEFALSFNTQYLDRVPDGCRKMPPGFGNSPAAQQNQWWANFNDGFQEYEFDDMTDIIRMIAAGYPAAPGIFGNDGRRKKANFRYAQSIWLDIDTGDHRALLSWLNGLRYINQTASFGYYTPGFTWAKPKCRIVWLLDWLVDDADVYEAMITAVHHQFNFADPACKDAARFYFGSLEDTPDGPDRFMFWGNVMSRETFHNAFWLPYDEHLERQRQRDQQQQAETQQNDNGKPLQVLIDARAAGLLRSLVSKVESQGPGKGKDGRHHACLRSVYLMAGMSKNGLVPFSETQIKNEFYKAMVTNNSVKDHGKHNVTKTISDAWAAGVADTANLKWKDSPTWSAGS